MEHARFGGVFYVVWENWRKFARGLFGLFLLVLAIIYQQLIFVYSVLVFGGANIFGYLFWDSIITVPSTAVMEVSNKDREIDLWLIPDAMLPEFDIRGLGQTYTDQFKTDVIVADEVDMKEREIKCAYSHKNIWRSTVIILLTLT